MSLTNLEREKLVTTLQRTFPLATKWFMIKNERKFYSKNMSGCARISAMAGVGAFLTFICAQLFMHLDASGWIASSVFCGTFVIFLGLITFLVGGYSATDWHHYIKRKWLAKNVEKHKPCMRDYAAQITSVKKVANALPKLSDSELLLLSKHPQLNPVFTPSFNEEFKRREKISVVEQINSEFLTNSVEVQSELPHKQTTPFQALNI